MNNKQRDEVSTRTAASYTPGPWAHYFDDSMGEHSVATSGHSRLIANVRGHEADANARLIAAAPELLAACTHILAKLELLRTVPGISGEDADILRAAIAKATGTKGA